MACVAETRQKSMNSFQPFFSSKIEEDVSDWLFTTELNLNAAFVTQENRAVVAASYLRANALSPKNLEFSNHSLKQEVWDSYNFLH